jgi:signal transduction histidine kinase
MNPVWRPLLRGLVIAAGAAVAVASLLAFRRGDWSIYAVFLLVSVVLYLPYVEVLPRLILGIPQMASTIGFLYIGGLPILVLALVAPVLTGSLRGVLPERWKARVPQLEGFLARREGTRLFAEQSTFILGLAFRWWIVSVLAPHVEPTAALWAIAVAEISGHHLWGLLAILPIYPERTLLPLSASGGLRPVLADIGLIVAFCVTPFVFLIAYGYQAEGLLGAAAWSLSTLGLHFMLQRLTERRLTVEEQNRRLEALNRELEHRERLSAIGKMSSVVSHQILQQLGVIGIYADLIRNADASREPTTVLAQARQNAGAIEGALGDVNRVLRDLLVFSKDLRLNLYEHPLQHVIDECLDECRGEAANRGVVLRTECPVEVTVTLDKLKMKQALVNVLRNAIEASPRGSEVLVRAALQDGSAEVAVSDSGPGIPERDREAVFTPFFTTKEHGTGLGLAIAREFTEAHGGRLSVAAHDGEPGATFVFHLPLRRE